MTAILEGLLPFQLWTINDNRYRLLFPDVLNKILFTTHVQYEGILWSPVEGLVIYKPADICLSFIQTLHLWLKIGQEPHPLHHSDDKMTKKGKNKATYFGE